MSKSGDVVVVRVSGNRTYEGVVWDMAGDTVLVCAPLAFKRYRAGGPKPQCVGFKKNDVLKTIRQTVRSN
jgi:hypothetical protein